MNPSIMQVQPENLPMPDQPTSLATRQAADAGAIQVNQQNPVGAMLQQVMAGGVTAENVAALEKMTALYMQVEAVNARRAFIEAKAALQNDLPSIRATRDVPNSDGTIRYTYAPFAEIMRAVGPALVKHGFSISFSQELAETRIVAVCTLSHVGGHSESNSFAVRAGKGPPGSSEAQADGSASTYAKRFALCNCLNIVIGDDDDDARRLGERITPQQAADLERRLKRVGGDVAAFLKMAHAESFAEIRQAQLGMLDDALAKKERAAAAKPTGPIDNDEADRIRQREAEESRRR